MFKFLSAGRKKVGMNKIRQAAIEVLEERRLFAVGPTLDRAFGGGDGIVTDTAGEQYIDLAYQGDGKLLALTSNSTLVRYNTNGSIDSAFGGGDGRVDLPIDARKVTLVSGNRIVVVGNPTDDFTTLALARLTISGSVDTTFGGGDGVTTYIGAGGADRTGPANDLVVRSGNFFVSGVNASGDVYVAKFDSNGSPDNAFGSDSGASAVTTLPNLSASSDRRMLSPSLSINANGQIFIAASYFIAVGPDRGSEFTSPSEYDVAVYALNANGSLATTFGGGDAYVTTNIAGNGAIGNSPTSEDIVRDLTILPNGQLVALIGYRTLDQEANRDHSHFVLARFSPGNGQLLEVESDTSFGFRPGGDYVLPSELALSGNKLHVVGQTNVFNNFDSRDSNSGFIARYAIAANGQLSADSSFNVAIGPHPTSHLLLADHPYLASDSTSYNSIAIDLQGRIMTTGGRSDYPTPAEYTLSRFTFNERYVDNDSTLEGAVYLNPGDTVSGALATKSDINMYLFYVEAGTTLGFDIDTGGSPLDSYMRLFSRDGSTLAQNDNAAAPGETLVKSPYISYTFAEKGFYYLGLSVAGNNVYGMTDGNYAKAGTGAAGAYTLTVFAPSTGDPNDQITTAIPIYAGNTLSNGIDNSTDVDIFVFSVKAGERLRFDIDNNGSPLDSYMRIFNRAGAKLASNDNAAAPGEQLHLSPYLDLTFSQAGFYYVGISGKTNQSYNPLTGLGDVASSMGAYTLQLLRV